MKPSVCSCVFLFLFASLSSSLGAVLVPISGTWRYNETETNLPSAWKTGGFNDSGWSSGFAPLGREPDNIPIEVETLLTNVVNGRPTFYFRTAFEFPTNPAGVVLQFTNLIDDGAVFYLNGAELFRVRMHSGAVEFSTLSADDVENAMFEVVRVAPTNLVQGQNILAVEVHQERLTSRDLIFATGVDYLWPQPIVIDSGPDDAEVSEYEGIVFFVSARGTDLSFQWYKDQERIGQDSNFLFLDEVFSTDAGGYYVVISSYGNVVTSRVATLTVTNLDVTPPVLLEAFAPVSAGNTNITLVFSESVTIDPSMISVDENGEAISVIGWIFRVESNFVYFAIAEPTMGKQLVVTLSGVTDRSGQANPLGFTRVVVRQQVVFADGNSFWHYDQSGSDAGSAWRMPGFNTEAWTIGPPVFGNERGPLPVPIRTTLNFSCCSGEPFATYYFVTVFDVADTNALQGLRLRTMIDDGAIFYLNGHEIHRIRMPAGEIHYRTLASQQPREPHQLEGPFSIALTNLVNGTNVLAAEVHQFTLTSDDTVFYAELSAQMKGWKPHISASHSSSNLNLSWSPGAMLETRDSFDEPWRPFSTATNIVSIPATNAAQFFRVSQ